MFLYHFGEVLPEEERQGLLESVGFLDKWPEIRVKVVNNPLPSLCGNLGARVAASAAVVAVRCPPCCCSSRLANGPTAFNTNVWRHARTRSPSLPSFRSCVLRVPSSLGTSSHPQLVCHKHGTNGGIPFVVTAEKASFRRAPVAIETWCSWHLSVLSEGSSSNAGSSSSGQTGVSFGIGSSRGGHTIGLGSVSTVMRRQSLPLDHGGLPIAGFRHHPHS